MKSNQPSEKTKNSKSKSPLSIFDILKEAKMKEASNEINPLDNLITILSQDLKILKNIDLRDEKLLKALYSEKEKHCIVDGKKILFIEVVFHALKKPRKNSNDILILKLFFLCMEKFMLLLYPLKVSINDILIKLIYKMKCEKKNKDIILFRKGDLGQKLYVILKGQVGVLISKEKCMECTQFEYIKYLIILYLYQENNLISEILYKNKKVVFLDEEIFFNLLSIFKIFNFLKENKRFKEEDYKSVFDFVQNDIKFQNYFRNKFNYSPMIPLNILSYSRKTVEKLYEFYSRKIIFMNKNLKFGLKGTEYITSFIKKLMNKTGIIKPTSQRELISFLKPYDEGNKKFKNEDEYYQKILSVNEISSEKIKKSSSENYISRIDPENILSNIRIDEEKAQKFKFIERNKNSEDYIKFKTIEFFEVTSIFSGSLFGELALTNANSKRAATIITKEECYFSIVEKQVYDTSLKFAQEKSQLKNISFFTNSAIFKGINASIFLNKFYFSFKRRAFKKGDILFQKGKERKSIFFIIKGEVELRKNMTLNNINELINLFGGVLEDKFLSFLLNTYQEFNKYYYNYIHNIKLCALKDKEIIGLDDMTINGINIFTCICSSSNKTEVYELDYQNLKEAKKFDKIVNNINKFVNMKRNLFVKILLEQRNTMISNEISKIKKAQKYMKGKIKNLSLTAKNNKNFFSSQKDNLAENKVILSYKQKKKEESEYLLNKKKQKNLFKNNGRIEFKKFMTNSASKIIKKKEEDIDEILTSFNYNRDNKYYISIRTKLKKKQSSENNKKENLKSNDNTIKIKKKIFSRNFMLLDSDNNSNFKLLNQPSKPIINNVYLFRTRKNIIPKFINSYAKKHKSGLSPFIMKESQKQFKEKRKSIYINNFYIQRQKVFDSLLENDNISPLGKNRALSSRINRMDKSDSKKKFNLFIKKTENKKILNNICGKNNNDSEKNNIKDFDFNLNKNYNTNKIRNKNNGFIDFLCLDNWEEKENFKKRYLSENNIN